MQQVQLAAVDNGIKSDFKSGKGSRNERSPSAFLTRLGQAQKSPTG
jgi:hypothetical protein